MTETDAKLRPILVVDDDPFMRTSLTDCLVSCGYPVETAVDGADALAKFRGGAYEMVITDIRMPRMGGLELLKNVKGRAPDTPVIVITAYGTVNTAVEAMKQGAADFVMKPFSLDDLEGVVKSVLERGREPEPAREGAPETAGAGRAPQRQIVTEDARMAELLEFLKNIAKSRSSVLIQGESGTGKELLARFIHHHSPRRNQPFVAVNCAAIPHTLLESEMFGYEKGAFTGAAQRRIGKFELADRGTLLLDEVSEMDMPLQAKLLRVIQESEIDRLGGKDPIPVDARIIANELAHALNPAAVTIAEDVSGMIGLARPLTEGGLGFDYRLAMGIPDYWIRLIKDSPDEAWPMEGIYHTLTNRRPGEQHVAYVESHDQALVGDKTIAFRLMDADMYWHMTKGSQNIVIERGVALHKMIRLVTFSLGGEAYLNFMGNEFGHPEWIDFPREGNNWSFKYARRQWSLADNPMLRYRDLAAFDQAMLALDNKYHLLNQPPGERLCVHEERKLLVYSRGPLVFAFNFHPTASYPDLRVGVPSATNYRLIINTDDLWFGGHAEVLADQIYPWQGSPCDGRPQSIQIYLPARTALVLAPLGQGPQL